MWGIGIGTHFHVQSWERFEGSLPDRRGVLKDSPVPISAILELRFHVVRL